MTIARSMLYGSTIFFLLASAGVAQVKPNWSAGEQPLADQLRGLRRVPDEARGGATRRLAAEIRRLPATPNKLALAQGLANLSTEGDFGRQTLQEVAGMLAAALAEQPAAGGKDGNAEAYATLAQLVRYEQVHVSLKAAPFAAALAKLEADDRRRASADFALQDLQGKEWKLSSLRGKVVLVNFWATWCPPCREEMPDLGRLYARFAPKGFVVLAISDEEAVKVAKFAQEQNVKYP
ncbi:MAG TPA: TlpA disulfide reductase family protein, partial [Bryobacteraceae bacterium]